MMVVTSRTGFPLRRKNAQLRTITTSGSLLTNCTNAMGPGTTSNASGAAPATHQINIVEVLHQSRCASVALVAVVAADVDPLQSISRPHPAPAVVVGGVGVGRANEGKAMEEPVMEVVPVMEREP
jgi:hypothetical protein